MNFDSSTNVLIVVCAVGAGIAVALFFVIRRWVRIHYLNPRHYKRAAAEARLGKIYHQLMTTCHNSGISRRIKIAWSSVLHDLGNEEKNAMYQQLVDAVLAGETITILGEPRIRVNTATGEIIQKEELTPLTMIDFD
jgi:hypothetical protein